MNDLCGIDYLEELRRTGVLSLKIEGRLKSIEYVRKTVRAYRMVLDALDSPAEKQQVVRREARQLLNQAMGRRRSTGYFNEQQRHTLVTPHISGHTGTMVGEIKGSASGKEGGIRAGLLVHLTLKAPLTVGDRLRFHDERTGTSQSFTLRSMQQQGRVVSQAGKGQRVALRIPASKGTAAGRRFKGRLFRVDVSARHERTKTMLARRVKRGWQPKVDQQSRAAILQEFPGITGSPDPQTAAGQQGGRRAGLHPADGGGGNTPQWWVRLRSLRDLRQRLPVKPAKIIVAITSQNLEYLAKANKGAKAGRRALIWALPPIIQEDELSWHREAVTFLRQAGYEEFQVSSLAQLGLFAALEPVQVHGDFRFNLLNSLALQQAYSAGLASVQFSIETDRHNAASTLRGYAAIEKARRSEQGKMKIGALVYGRPALFSSRLQNKQLHSLRSIVSPHGEAFTLDRADGLTSVRAQVPYSLLGHHHALTAFGLDFFVLDVSVGQLHKEGAMIRSLLGGKGPSEPILSGNFDGGLS